MGSYNPLSKLPESAQWGELKVGTLNLEDCRLRHLPEEFFSIRIKKDLIIDGNPLRDTSCSGMANLKIGGLLLVDPGQKSRFLKSLPADAPIRSKIEVYDASRMVAFKRSGSTLAAGLSATELLDKRG